MSLFNYVQTVQVAKATGSNVGTSLPTIESGDILFLNAKNSQVLTPATIAALGDNEPIVIAMGLALGKPRLSNPIKRRDVQNGLGAFTRQPYAASTQKVVSIATAMTAGKKYRLTVVLKDELRIISNRQTRLEIPDFVATADVAADVAKLANRVTKYKATYGLLKGVAGAGGELRIEGLPVPTESVLDEYQFVDFSVSFVELEDGATSSVTNGIPRVVTEVSKATPGSGLPVQLRAIERMADGHLGNTDLRSFDRLPNASRIAEGGKYDLIHLIHFDKHQGDHEFTMESPLQTTIAVETGSPLAGFVETMLKAFLGKDAAATTTSPTSDPDKDGGAA